MKIWIVFLLSLWTQTVAAASSSPLLSNLGDCFRTGEASLSLISQVVSDFNAPFASAIPGSPPITLALSLVEYDQTINASNTVQFQLLENTPTPSTTTQAIFRVNLQYYLQVSLFKVRFLGCPTAVLSQDFSIIVA